MEKRCVFCGELLSDDGDFCPNCDDEISNLLHEKDIIAVFPDYPCRKCKTVHKANCRCGKWESWWGSKWRAIQSNLKRENSPKNTKNTSYSE